MSTNAPKRTLALVPRIVFDLVELGESDESSATFISMFTDPDVAHDTAAALAESSGANLENRAVQQYIVDEALSMAAGMCQRDLVDCVNSGDQQNAAALEKFAMYYQRLGSEHATTMGLPNVMPVTPTHQGSAASH